VTSDVKARLFVQLALEAMQLWPRARELMVAGVGQEDGARKSEAALRVFEYRRDLYCFLLPPAEQGDEPKVLLEPRE